MTTIDTFAMAPRKANPVILAGPGQDRFANLSSLKNNASRVLAAVPSTTGGAALSGICGRISCGRPLASRESPFHIPAFYTVNGSVGRD